MSFPAFCPEYLRVSMVTEIYHNNLNPGGHPVLTSTALAWLPTTSLF